MHCSHHSGRESSSSGLRTGTGVAGPFAGGNEHGKAQHLEAELIDTRKDKRYVKRTANEWSSTPPRRPAIDESVRGRLRDRA